MTREEAERIRNHGILHWQSIVNSKPLPEVCLKYPNNCSFCDAFLLTIYVLDVPISSCGPCPLKCFDDNSLFSQFVNSCYKIGKARAILKAIEAITVEQLMELEMVNDEARS